MSKSLPEQVAEAEKVFRQAYKSKPRAGRTMRLHWQFVELKRRLLNHRTRAPASAPVGQQTAEVA